MSHVILHNQPRELLGNMGKGFIPAIDLLTYWGNYQTILQGETHKETEYSIAFPGNRKIKLPF